MDVSSNPDHRGDGLSATLWSLGEQLENLRSDALPGLKSSPTGYLPPTTL